MPASLEKPEAGFHFKVTGTDHAAVWQPARPPRRVRPGKGLNPLSGPLSFHQTATAAPPGRGGFTLSWDTPLLLQDTPSKDIVLFILSLQSHGWIIIRLDCLFGTSIVTEQRAEGSQLT